MKRLLAILALLVAVPMADARPRPVRRLIEAIQARRHPPVPPATSALHVYPNGTSSASNGSGAYDISVTWMAIYPGSIVLEGPQLGNAITFGQSGTAMFMGYPAGNYRTAGLCGTHGDLSPWIYFSVP